MNEVTPIEKEKLPKIDSKVRPDQKLYEEGKVDEAGEEKMRIEKKQRETRAPLAENSIPCTPQWFLLEDSSGDKNSESVIKDNQGINQVWKFAGQYWKLA